MTLPSDDARARALAIATLLLAIVLLAAGCGAGDDDGAGDGGEAAQQAAGGTLQQAAGRPVSASDEQIVIETPDGQRTFQIKPEDVAAVGPGHVQSHVGIETLAFRISYRTEDGTDYAVSAEEIPASSLEE